MYGMVSINTYVDIARQPDLHSIVIDSWQRASTSSKKPALLQNYSNKVPIRYLINMPRTISLISRRSSSPAITSAARKTSARSPSRLCST